MNHKASIAIFKNSTETDDLSQPRVPDDVFEAAKRVIENKGCEVIKARDGLYVVKYSETGPFPRKVNDEWLPVYVAKIHAWASGGIKATEMDAYNGDAE